jgi:hypothetical protein
MARLARSSSACPPAYGENLDSVAALVAQPASASIATIASVVLMGSPPPKGPPLGGQNRSPRRDSPLVAIAADICHMAAI